MERMIEGDYPGIECRHKSTPCDHIVAPAVPDKQSHRDCQDHEYSYLIICHASASSVKGSKLYNQQTRQRISKRITASVNVLIANLDG